MSSALDNFLNQAVGKKGCACSECNYTKEIDGKPGEYVSPCKMSHTPGKDVKTCKDCSESRYHPKK